MTYTCEECGYADDDKSYFVKKEVAFRTLGAGPKDIRRRVIARVCLHCMSQDPQYLAPSRAGQHGFGVKT